MIGQLLGNYRLTKLLGHGGFADVYLGQHIRLSTSAAIKVLHAPLSPEEISNFQDEAKVIANLQHPHIVRVLDFDVSDGIPFLVMEYCPGGTLRQRHPRGKRLELPTVVRYVNQIAGALQYIHDQKLIHRDVKPENMLSGQEDAIMLSDFGIAAAAHSTSSMSVQVPIGTISYIAPEQIYAQARPASDQYALGVVVYEWLCGEYPFVGSDTEIYAKHLKAQPLSLCQKVPTISSDVEQVVLKALNKDPHQRFPTIQAFAIALEQASQPLVLRPVQTPSPRPMISVDDIPAALSQPQDDHRVILNAEGMHQIITQRGITDCNSVSRLASQPPAVKAYVPWHSYPLIKRARLIIRSIIEFAIKIKEMAKSIIQLIKMKGAKLIIKSIIELIIRATIGSILGGVIVAIIAAIIAELIKESVIEMMTIGSILGAMPGIIIAVKSKIMESEIEGIACCATEYLIIGTKKGGIIGLALGSILILSAILSGIFLEISISQDVRELTAIWLIAIPAALLFIAYAMHQRIQKVKLNIRKIHKKLLIACLVLLFIYISIIIALYWTLTGYALAIAVIAIVGATLAGAMIGAIIGIISSIRRIMSDA